MADCRTSPSVPLAMGPGPGPAAPPGLCPRENGVSWEMLNISNKILLS